MNSYDLITQARKARTVAADMTTWFGGRANPVGVNAQSNDLLSEARAALGRYADECDKAAGEKMVEETHARLDEEQGA